MGCYGIGVNRTMSAVVEQHNDGRGIIWPLSVAPFHVYLTGIARSEADTAQVDGIYDMLKHEGFDVLYDDRKVSPGIRFADADLIGIPVRVVAGKNFFAQGEVEIKLRKSSEPEYVKKELMAGRLKELLATLE